MHRCAAIKAAAGTEPEAGVGWMKKGRRQAQKGADWGLSGREESWEAGYMRTQGGQGGRGKIFGNSGRHQNENSHWGARRG